MTTICLNYEIWLFRKSDDKRVLYTNKRFQTVQHAHAWIDEQGIDYTGTEWSYKVEPVLVERLNPHAWGIR